MSVAKGLSIYGNGVNLAKAFKEFNPTAEQKVVDATTLNDTYEVFELGFKTGTVSTNGCWKYDQTELDEIHNIFSSAFTNQTNVILTAALEAYATGNPAIMVDGTITKLGFPMQVGQLIMCSADFQATNGIAFGKWLFNSAVDDETMNGTSVDNAAATSNGGILHVHVQNVDLTDLSNAGFKLQHSTDNSTWVDLIGNTGFDTDPLFTSMSVRVAAGTTVRRYLRFVGVTSGGIATFQAAFARR